ncbi:MAG: amidohydrolase family protein [Candidatus Latescibacteria bacterium]|nr:amidohydrolase family protein [Candidatus Latescibacterota bacterium]
MVGKHQGELSMLPFFDYTEVDTIFYEQHIAPRIPSKIFDVHVHIFQKSHVEMIPEKSVKAHWASECAHVLTCEDTHACARELYPDTEYGFAGFPTASPEADTKGMNNYVAKMGYEGKCVPLMMVRPEWDPEEIEREFLAGDFVGFKPYPGMVKGISSGEVGIFEFLPHEQWEILNRHKKSVMLHIGRKERFADAENIHDLLTAREKYPDVTIIIAHLGRSYNPYYLRIGLGKMGNPEGFYFDTTAVVNPDVYDMAFAKIPLQNILYGSDMHVLLWHGKREWDERNYYNFTRENFSWNTNRKSPEEEAAYTIFLYEQMKSILDAMDRHGLSESQKIGIFGENTKYALRINT